MTDFNIKLIKDFLEHYQNLEDKPSKSETDLDFLETYSEEYHDLKYIFEHYNTIENIQY